MYKDNELKTRMKVLELNQENILRELSEIEIRISGMTDVIIKYFGSYKDKKLSNFKKAMQKGSFTKDQFSALEEMTNILKEVLNDIDKEDID